MEGFPASAVSEDSITARLIRSPRTERSFLVGVDADELVSVADNGDLGVFGGGQIGSLIVLSLRVSWVRLLWLASAFMLPERLRRLLNAHLRT